jgi:hypothetical protein
MLLYKYKNNFPNQLNFPILEINYSNKTKREIFRFVIISNYQSSGSSKI